ncbi:MAG: hypothetical protein VW891_01980, partial [Novosphingobium sp.]
SRVSSSFAHLDTMTQQNAAMVEESNAAAHELARAAEELRRLVSRFRTSGYDGRAERSPPTLRVA